MFQNEVLSLQPFQICEFKSPRDKYLQCEPQNCVQFSVEFKRNVKWFDNFALLTLCRVKVVSNFNVHMKDFDHVGTKFID